MSVRQARHRAQEMHGHYNVHSYRQTAEEAIDEAYRFDPEGGPYLHASNRRVRTGIGRSPWRKHV